MKSFQFNLIRECALFLVLLFCFSFSSAFAQQQTSFNINDYKEFLQANEGIGYQQLLSMHPMGEYQQRAPLTFANTLYADSIQYYYNLSEDEMKLLEEHSFMVTDRVRYDSFGNAFYMIFKRDLPVYLSSDAVLHALHMSYSSILKHLESNAIRPELAGMLKSMHAYQATLEQTYGDMAGMKKSLKDVDLYLTVALKLLNEDVELYYSDNQEKLTDVLEAIESEDMKSMYLFTDVVKRKVDFSQFTPRGHYTDSKVLTSYFQAMMWLGRVGFYLTTPNSRAYNMLSEAQKQQIGRRQSTDALLIHEALQQDNNRQVWEEIEQALQFFVGKSDNVNPVQMGELKEAVNIEDAASTTDSLTYLAFRDTLANKPYAGQRILSQLLMNDPADPDKIQPPSTFRLFGQRFIIDSFITGQVVYDRINSKRMLPEAADVFFALGNNYAAPLIEEDLKTHEYSDKLAAMRYLVDSYESDFWYSSFFNSWLQAIRTLNPVEDPSGRPEFTQTQAWVDKTLTTQMASWAELRHDNLLYAKQSYTGGIICSYPYSYVEPNPDFFEAVSRLAVNARTEMAELELLDEGYLQNLISYFEDVEEISNQLATIAQKEIDLLPLNESEQEFLKSMLFEVHMCGRQLDGWYVDLYYKGETDALEKDMVVADIHTSPTDQAGNMVGWVKHIGTGPLNLAIISAEHPSGQKISFVGPVMSYFEHVSTNFERLTDEEWQTAYNAEASMRPDYTKSYLYNSPNHYNDSLFTDIENVDEAPPTTVPSELELQQNYPNPFNAGTVVPFKIPKKFSGKRVTLKIIDIEGRVVATIVDESLPAGNYTARWNPALASGAYIYKLRVGDRVATGKMMLIK